MLLRDVVFKNLRRRASRTLMTVAGLAVAVTGITTIWNTVWSYSETSNQYYSARKVDIVVVRTGVSNRLTSSLRADLAPQLAALPGVASVDSCLTEMVSLDAMHLVGIPLRGLEPDGDTMKSFATAQGQSLSPTDHGKVLLGSGIAAALQSRMPDQIEIEGTMFQIAGVFEANNPFDINSIVAPLPDVQQLMEHPGIVSEFQLRVTPDARNETSLKQLCHAIESLQDESHRPLGLEAQTTNDFVASATEAQLGDAMAWATSAIVLILSFLAMLNTMLMSVMERTSELGVLRAVGWTRQRVVRMIVGESLVIGALAGMTGLIAAWVLVRALSQSPVAGLFVPRHLSGCAAALGCGAAIGASIVGSFYPAFYAASVPPVEALRYE
jgi:putative ABC transport system permease protein